MLFGQQMSYYLYTNVIGTFIVDEQGKIIDQNEFRSLQEYSQKEITEKKLLKKYPQAKPLPLEKAPAILAQFKHLKFFPIFYTRNLALTQEAIKHSVTKDQLIIQAIANINELDKICNILTKRLREWYSLYLPELSETISNNERFGAIVGDKNRSEILQDLNITELESMGAELKLRDVQEMQQLASRIKTLYTLRQEHERYLGEVMREHCPNFLELAGITIGARLIELGRSLKHLALLPASTIQLLGAEKALFRHIKTGSRSPKYGVIFSHPLIQTARGNERGKVSRVLADKLSLCARLDYFKGEFKAPEYKRELEQRFGKKHEPEN